MFISKFVRLLAIYFIASSFFISHQIYAQDDCYLFTVPITLSQSDQEQITSKIKLPDSNRELMTFSNGDMLISSVDSCGLGLELLYFSQFPFENIESRYKKVMWLAKITGRDLLINQLKDKRNEMTKGFSFSLIGHGEDELHTIKSSILTATNDTYPEIFSESISYLWVPPSGIE